MHLRKFTLGLIIGLFGATYAADWYVDASASSDGADGSELKPFKTIQAAVDAASANDTIRVAEGVYAEGAKVVEEGSASKSVVSIINKKLHLIGAGKGKTVIAGSRNPDVRKGFSESVSLSAIRCVIVRNSDGTIIEGVTLRDGETCTNGTKVENFNAGGGLYSNSKEVYLVDSEIVHCAALYGAAMYQGTAIRCLIDGSFGKTGIGGHTTRLVNCIVTRSVPEGGSTGTMYKSELYNCTLVDNGTVWAIQHKEDKVYNSLLLLSSNSLGYRETNTVETLVANSVLASQSSRGNMQLMGPAVGDWRLLPDSDAVDAGLLSHLESLELPTCINPKLDFNGDKIESDSNGRINVGAVQSVGVPAAGALWFNGNVEVNGRESCNAKAAVYVYPSTFPTQYCVRAAANDRDNIFRLTRYDFSGNVGSAYPSILPQRDGRMWLVPPTDISLVSTNEIRIANAVLYVDANHGNDNWGTDITDVGSENHPYASIQAAVAAATTSFTLVKVRPGDYKTGSSSSDSKGRFRVYVNDKKICIRSVCGPENTKIWGEPDFETKGLGSAAVKCVYLKGRDAYLQGFTLTDGYTAGAEAINDDMKTGAAIHSVPDSPTYSATVADCIITNCYAYEACVLSSTLHRTRVLDCNSADGVIVDKALLWGCYFKDCNDNKFGLINCDAFQSTFVGMPREGRIGNGKETSYNCIWDGGINVYSTSVFTNSITWNVKNHNGNPTAWINVNPLFVSREEDGTLYRNSPAVGIGCDLWDSEYGTRFWTLAGGDINGNPITFTRGRPTVGAFQRTSEQVAVSATEPVQGGWAFLGATQFGEMVLDKESTDIEIVPASGSRPCIGVMCGGCDFLFTNCPNEKIVLDYAVLSRMEGILNIEGIYSTDWYADDDGDDSNTGFLPSRPKRTLATAASILSKGDTLWVMPGTYSEGKAWHRSENNLASRIVLKEGTFVISTHGAEQTVIKGGSATISPDGFGGGINAIRCAYVSKNARLSGFTLTGGRTNPNGDDLDASGAGVCGADRSSNCVVDNCILSNNVGKAGTAYKVDVFDSFFAENTSSGSGVCVRQGNAYNCSFTGNIGNSVISYPEYIIGCTIAADNVKVNGAKITMLDNLLQSGYIFNSLFAGDLSIIRGSSISNVVCGINSSFSNVTTGNIHMVDFSTQSFVDGSVPVVGANEAVDAADESLVTNLYSKTDLRGFQRVMNGRLDIGAYEADWRENYASTLCSKQGAITVETASPEVRLEDGRIKIPSGTLTATWHNDTGKKLYCLIPVKVTGSGTLIVILDEETIGEFTVEDGDRVLEFSSDATENALEFVYSPVEGDTGCAVISGFTRSRRIGFAVSIR